MDDTVEYNVNISFDNKEAMLKFMNELSLFSVWRDRKKVKRTNERRGSGTKKLHEMAKEIQSSNIELSYRDCLKQAGEILRNNNETVSQNNVL